MKMTFARKALLSAAVSAALLPVAMTATASPDRPEGPRHEGGEMRAELFDRAGIDAETREALKQAAMEHRQEVKELNDDFREQRMEILGEDGVAALERARHELREERINDLVDKWELSDDERDAFNAARESFKEGAEALKAQEFENPEARHDAWRELMSSTRDQLAEILDERQLRELKHTMMPGHGDHPRGGPGEHRAHGPDKHHAPEA